MAAQCHQLGDNGRLPESHVAHDHRSSVVCQFRVPQAFLYPVKEPVPSHEHRVGGDAWHFKQQRLQQDVLWLVGGKPGFKKADNTVMESAVT